MGPHPHLPRQSGSDRGSRSISLRTRSSPCGHHAAAIAGDREGLRKLVVPEPCLKNRPKSIWDRLGFQPFRGMWNDIRRRTSYYLTDWTDAWTSHFPQHLICTSKSVCPLDPKFGKLKF